MIKNVFGSFFQTIFFSGRLVDHDIRLPVGALKEDYYESENQSPPLIMNFEKQYAGRRREHSDKLWTLPIPYIIDNSVGMQ